MKKITIKIQGGKSLRSDSSLLLKQTASLIHIDKMIDQGNECGKSYTCANYHCRHVRSHKVDKWYECN